MRAYAFGLFVHCAVIGLIAAQSPSPAGAQPADTSVRSALTRYSERMATLAAGLDRASALAGRASRIADPANAPAAAPSGSRAGGVSPGPNAAGLSADEVMAGLRQLVAQRTEVLQLAATVAGKLNAQTPAAPAARSSAIRNAEASIESYIGLAGDLAKGDIKADVAAARAALDALRSAAQAAAARSWRNASAATAAGVVPERIAQEIGRKRGSAPDLRWMSVEDALFVVLALSRDDARDALRTALAKATQEHDRVYRAAVKASLAVDSAIIDLGFAAADLQLKSRRAAAVESGDLAGRVRYLIGNAGNLTATDVKDERKKLGEQLSDLKQQKKQIISQLIELEQKIAQMEADCAAAADRVQAALKAAAIAAGRAAFGAALGGMLGGPVGAAIGAAMGAASGPSPEDIAKLEGCKSLIELMKQIEELKAQLAKIEVAIKEAMVRLEEIRKKEQEVEERLRTSREGVTVSKPKGSAAKLKEGDAVRRTPSKDSATAKTRQDAAKNAPVVERPCGTPDKPCRPAASSRTATPGGGGSAMDRLRRRRWRRVGHGRRRLAPGRGRGCAQSRCGGTVIGGLVGRGSDPGEQHQSQCDRRRCRQSARAPAVAGLICRKALESLDGQGHARILDDPRHLPDCHRHPDRADPRPHRLQPVVDAALFHSAGERRRAVGPGLSPLAFGGPGLKRARDAPQKPMARLTFTGREPNSPLTQLSV